MFKNEIYAQRHVKLWKVPLPGRKSFLVALLDDLEFQAHVLLNISGSELDAIKFKLRARIVISQKENNHNFSQ